MSLDIGCKDSICALSSAQGQGAIAIVRLSGPDTPLIFNKLFKRHQGELAPRLAMHGLVLDKDGHAIDDVMALYFPDTQSFTGEPSAEIYCHGNMLLIKQILDRMCELGARLAEAGEFSMRALLHGKIDLAQAESIADLIHAQSLAAKDAALQGVQGGLRARVADIHEMLIMTLAEIEARMDFPDEELGSYDKSHISNVIGSGIAKLASLLANANYALRLHEGARVVICGVPNAGKSTLLNQLCGEERAIVHQSAGTTRDVIEARLEVQGVPIVLVDIAGIREVSESEVEAIGINKAQIELKRAQLIIWLADAGVPEPFIDPLISEFLSKSSAPVLRVLNKVDLLLRPLTPASTQELLRPLTPALSLKGRGSHQPAGVRSPSPLEGEGGVRGPVAISAHTGVGLDELKAKLHELLIGSASASREIFITRARQRDELVVARDAMIEAQFALQMGQVDEVITSLLRSAGLAFDRLFGTDLSENILDKIFSQFCIGK